MDDKKRGKHELVCARPVGLNTVGAAVIEHLRAIALGLAAAAGIASAVYVPLLERRGPLVKEFVGIHARTKR